VGVCTVRCFKECNVLVRGCDPLCMKSDLQTIFFSDWILCFLNYVPPKKRFYQEPSSVSVGVNAVQ
jgi:hypothetical protein